MPDAVGPDFRCRLGAVHERVVCRNPVGAILAAAQGIDPQDRPEGRREILSIVLRVVGRAAIADGGIEQPKVGGVFASVGIERNRSYVVRRRELRVAKNLPGRTVEDVGCGGRTPSTRESRVRLVLSAHVEHELPDGVILKIRTEARRYRGERGIELAVTGFPLVGKLRVKGEPEQSGFVGVRGVVEADIPRVEIEIHDGIPPRGVASRTGKPRRSLNASRPEPSGIGIRY